jgi:hypothetical protein
MTTPQVALQAANKPAKADEWKARLFTNAQALKLKITAWQAGGGARTIFAVVAFALELADAAASAMVQGGFFDFAGSGTVSYTDPLTKQTIVQAVTPEGGPGWLDVLASSTRDVNRIEATYAGGPLAITNTSASTYGPLTSGTYHVSNPSNEQSYTTTADVTIPPSAVVGTVAGITSYFGLIEVETAAAHGLVDGDAVSIQGVIGVTPLASPTAWYVLVRDATHFTLTGSSHEGAYTSGGTVYSPTLTTVQADVVGTIGDSANAAGFADVNTVTQPVSSLVGVTVANLTAYRGTDLESNEGLTTRARAKVKQISPKGPSGAYEYAALSASELAPLLTPPLVLASAVTRCFVHADAADGRVFTWIANSSGPSSPEDVVVVDAVVDAVVVPQAQTSKVLAATNRAVACAITVWLPGQYISTDTQELIQRAVQSYFRTLAVGGVSDPAGTYTNVVPRNVVIGVVFDVLRQNGIPVEQLQVLLNGQPANVQLVVNTLMEVAEVAVLTPVIPTVHLVTE